MSNENSGSPVQGLETAQLRPSSLAELLSVSQEEQNSALAAEGAAKSASAKEPRMESASSHTSDLTVVEDDETPEAAAPTTPAAEIRKSEVTAMPTQPAPSVKPASKYTGLRVAGSCLALMGAALLVAPMASSAFASWLGNQGELRAQSGTMLIAGLCLFGVSILMRSLSEMRTTLDDVSNESQRLESIAVGGKRVFETLDQVRIEHMVLAREVVHLQTKLRRLIDIVSNPDYTASIYRLAASVDQLGKEVDSSMKGRFDDLQQQLVDLAQHASQAEQQLEASFGRIPTLMVQQQEQQQQTMKKVMERQQSGTDEVEALIEQSLAAATRIEAAIHNQQEIVAGSFVSLLENSNDGTAGLAASLGAMRADMARTIGEQAQIVRTEFSHLDNRLDVGERSLSSGVDKLCEQITKQFSEHSEDLHQGLNTLVELGGNNGRLVKQELGALAQRLEQQAREQAESLREAREQAVVATASARNEIMAQVTLLDSSISALISAQSEQQCEMNAEMLQATQEMQREAGAQAQQHAAALQRDIAQNLDQQRKSNAETLQATRDMQREAGAQAQQHAAALQRDIAQNLDQQRQSNAETLQAAQEMQREAGAQAQQQAEALQRDIAQNMDQQRQSNAQTLQAARDMQREAGAQAQQHAAALQHEVAQNLAQLAALVEQKASEQQSLAVESAQAARSAAESAGQAVNACIEALSAQIEKLRAEQRDDLQQTSLQSLEVAGGARRELVACMDQITTLAGQLERISGEQREDLQRTSQRSLEATLGARRELAGCLEQLESRLAQQVRDQQDLMLESALHVQHSAEASKAELVAAFEQVGARLEHALTTDMQTVAEVFDTLTEEVRACLDHSHVAKLEPQAEPAYAEHVPAELEAQMDCTPSMPDAQPCATEPAAATQAQIAREFQTHADADMPIVWPEPQDGAGPWRDPWPRDRS